MTILLEFYDVYSLTQIMEAVKNVVEGSGYKIRKNPTLDLYAKGQYHGIIHIFISINKQSKTVVMKMNSTSPAIWSSRCEAGWDVILRHNMESTEEIFTFPEFEVDLSELSEEMKSGLLVSCLGGSISGEMIVKQSGFQTTGQLSRPNLTSGFVPEDKMKNFNLVVFASGPQWASVLTEVASGKDGGTYPCNAFFVEKESLEEIVGCTLEAIKSQFDFSNTLTKGNKELKVMLDPKGGNWNGHSSTIIAGGIVRTSQLEEASDTNGGLLSRMIQKLPKEKMHVSSCRLRHVPKSGMWIMSLPIGNNAKNSNMDYYLYAVRHDGLVRKVWVKIENQKITIKDEILS